MRRPPRGPGRRAGPSLVQRHPTRRAGQGHRLLPPGGRRRARALAPPTPCATTSRPSTSTPQAGDPDPCSGSTWPSGSAPPSVRRATPPTRHPARCRPPGRRPRRHRATGGGLPGQRPGHVQLRRRRGRGQGRHVGNGPRPSSGGHLDRALVLAQLCQELLYGSPLERRRALAEEAIALALASPDDAAIVRVLNHVSIPLRVPQLLEQSLAWSADALAPGRARR